MSDLPPAVEEYFNKRDLDPALLDDIPLTKKAFKELSKAQLDAIEMLNKLGDALEKDFKDGKHVKKQTDAAPSTPDQEVNTYRYAIH